MKTKQEIENEIYAENLDLWKRYSQPQRARIARWIANSEAQKDPSDPFMYARTFSHVYNCVTHPIAYGWKWEQVVAQVGTSFDSERVAA